jgi:hypothetical protein
MMPGRSMHEMSRVALPAATLITPGANSQSEL